MNAYKVLRYHREEFVRELGLKTGWGRNEIIEVFNRTKDIALERYIQEEEQATELRSIAEGRRGQQPTQP